MHAYASDDPVFRAMNARGQRETDGGLGDFCVKCHAPMALNEKATTDGLNLDAVPQALHGVTCFYCHTVDLRGGGAQQPARARERHHDARRVLGPRGEHGAPGGVLAAPRSRSARLRAALRCLPRHRDAAGSRHRAHLRRLAGVDLRRHAGGRHLLAVPHAGAPRRRARADRAGPQRVRAEVPRALVPGGRSGDDAEPPRSAGRRRYSRCSSSSTRPSPPRSASCRGATAPYGSSSTTSPPGTR